jgi:MFS family permease
LKSVIGINWLTSNAAYRSVFGSLAASFFADLIGRKLIFAIAFAFVLAGITCEFVAVTPAVFLVGKLLNGFATGAFSTVTITYLGEV